MSKLLSVLVLGGLLAFVGSAEARKRNWDKGAEQAVLDCLDGDREAIEGSNNEQVMDWKQSTPNQYKDRALVVGTLSGVLLDRRSHLHLEIDMVPDQQYPNQLDHIEIVYNKAFGEVDKVRSGLTVSACGDYITAREQAGPYKPSPVDAIVHWVHASSTPNRHAHGFLMIDGTLYGHAGEADDWKKPVGFSWDDPFAALFPVNDEAGL